MRNLRLHYRRRFAPKGRGRTNAGHNEETTLTSGPVRPAHYAGRFEIAESCGRRCYLLVRDPLVVMCVGHKPRGAEATKRTQRVHSELRGPGMYTLLRLPQTSGATTHPRRREIPSFRSTTTKPLPTRVGGADTMWIEH